MIKLETERLCLRDYVETDFEAYYKLKTDDKTMYYLQDIKLDDRETAQTEFDEVLADIEMLALKRNMLIMNGMMVR